MEQTLDFGTCPVAFTANRSKTISYRTMSEYGSYEQQAANECNHFRCSIDEKLLAEDEQI